jgi:4-alpha-glucanotransferase
MGEILRAVLAELASGPARLVVVNLEDLWLEVRPQNVPGTVALDRYPNWRRRARLSLEEFSIRPSVIGPLEMVARLRAEQRPAPGVGRVRGSTS